MLQRRSASLFPSSPLGIRSRSCDHSAPVFALHDLPRLPRNRVAALSLRLYLKFDLPVETHASAPLILARHSSSRHLLYPTGECRVYALAILSYFPTDFSATFGGRFSSSNCPAVCEPGIFSSAGTIGPATPTCLYLTFYDAIIYAAFVTPGTTEKFGILFYCVPRSTSLTWLITNLHIQFLAPCDSRCRVPATGILDSIRGH
ncbi:hypothetical protein K438DRAFT_735200 [Mycena galopus ATCC 62051]|nr:hypothetical protein K438DRAFT_735200 [Mycena galopus ATCC 62051]